MEKERNVPEASHEILDAIRKKCFDKTLTSHQVPH
jgi:hypothetical protein